uniref:IS30 family transposase n=1 Tax=Nitrosomonas supralitoralis TaxID=2116706 RepID=UPI0035A89FBD
MTLAERKSRYILAAQVFDNPASGVTAAVTRLLRPHKGKCYTMTFDNGKEFAEHQTISAELDADVYFAHPYHSWERGLNENSGGRWIDSTIDHAMRYAYFHGVRSFIK